MELDSNITRRNLEKNNWNYVRLSSEYNFKVFCVAILRIKQAKEFNFPYVFALKPDEPFLPNSVQTWNSN